MREFGQRSSAAITRGAHWSIRHLWEFWMAPFVDKYNGLSLNRFLAILFAIAATHGRLAHDSPLTGWDNTMATIAGALAFGKDTFLAYLNRRKEDGHEDH